MNTGDEWMAERLRPCEQCGNRLAANASRCPKCGGLTGRAQTARLVVALLIVVGLAVGGGLYVNHRQQTNDHAHCIAGGTDAAC